MYIKNKNLSLLFKILIIIVGIYGLYDSCFKTSLVSKGEHFSYFTNLSNALCILFYIAYIIKILFNFNCDTIFHFFKGASTLCIVITGIVYNFILRPFMTSVDGVMDLNSVGNYIVHLIVPLMVILDYFIFDEKGKLNKKDPFKWLALPFLYFLFICLRASMGKTFIYTNSRYPYFFLDIDAYGLLQVLLNVLIAIILIIILGFIFLFIDKHLSKNIIKKV